MEVIYRNLKLEVKVWCWEAKAPEKKKADSIKGWAKKKPVQTILFSLLHPSSEPPNVRNLWDAFNQFFWQRFNSTFECWQMSCQNQQFPVLLRKDSPQVIQSNIITGTDRVLSWNAHPFSGFRILSKRHQVRAIMYEITKNFLTWL